MWNLFHSILHIEDTSSRLLHSRSWRAGPPAPHKQSTSASPLSIYSIPRQPSAYGACRLHGVPLNYVRELEMKKRVPVESASALIDDRIKELGDWRGKMLAKVRGIVHETDPEIVEEWKFMGTPVFSRGGIVCTGEAYKSVVKMTFAKGAALKDPAGLFNSSLDGNVRRAIDIHKGEKVDEAALKDLIRAAVALNLKGQSKPKLKLKPGRASSKRTD
jgi:hypothetical protein